MSRAVLSVAWYRFRATLRQRLGGYLAIVLLVGLLGGIAMGAIASARRTQASFPIYVASTNPAQFDALNAYLDPTIGDDRGFYAARATAIARLPHVEKAETVLGFDANLVLLNKLHTHARPGEKPPVFEGSTDGEFADEDRVTLVGGRLANPARPDEVVMNVQATRQLGLRIGSIVRLGFNSDAQLLSPSCCTLKADPPVKVVDLHLVGIIVVAQTIFQDDVDALGSQIAIFTPALTRELARCCATYSGSALQVSGGARGVAAVHAEVDHLLGPTAAAAGANVVTPPINTATAERAIRPESIALGVFGAIAALAALLIAAQVLARQLRLSSDDLVALRALGANPTMSAADGLIGVVAAVVTGALLACGVAVCLSPLSPLGPVRPVYPSRGFAGDWTVLGLGFAVLVIALGTIAIALARRFAPRGAVGRGARTSARSSAIVRAVSRSGLPAPALTGIRLAFEPGSGRNAVPVRSAILGAVVAITVVTASFTFGSSLDRLVSRPPLYGWNWSYMLLSGFSGDEDLPAAESATLLHDDPDVAQFAGVYFGSLMIDGQSVPVLGITPGAAVQPPLLAGHGLHASDQIVLGAATMAKLRTSVGGVVQVSDGLDKAASLTVVGSATMPAIGTTSQHLEMGNGAVLDETLIPAAARNLQQSAVSGPNAYLIRLRSNASPTAALASLRRINATLAHSPDSSGGIVGVLRPAEISNYRSIGTLPAILGGSLAAGAIVAFGLTLVASVRRRRRHLALLKASGFTRRQLVVAVACQSSASVGIGAIIGVPLGIVVGRALWDLFASDIHAVPAPSIPALTIALIIIGAVVLANLAAAVPACIAARTPTALVLRAE